MCGVIVITESLKKKFVEEYALPADTILVARDAVDLPMFEFCAFKSLLPNVFNINFEKENTVKDLLGEKKNLHSINNIKDFNVDPNNKYKSKGKLFIIN